MRNAISAFRDAEWGIRDAFEALALAQKKCPQIDRDRVYVAGHSSAGTLALQIASSTNRVKACAAFAPVCDIAQHLDSFMAVLDQWVPGIASGLREASPNNRIAKFNCPVFLFHAMDDSVVTPPAVIAFKDDLLRKGVTAKYVAVNSGEHYDSMIEQGIPQAIQWLKEIDAEATKLDK